MRFNLFAAKVLLLFQIRKHPANFSVFNFKPNLRFKRIKYERYAFIPSRQNMRLKRKKINTHERAYKYTPLFASLFALRTLLSLACGILTIFVSLYKIIFFIFHQSYRFCKIFVKIPSAKSAKRTFLFIL